MQHQPLHELHWQVSFVLQSCLKPLLTFNHSSSLVRIETSMMKALERQAAPEEVIDDDDQLAPLQKCKTVPAAGSDPSDADGHGLGIRRQFTETTLVEPNVGASPDSTPSLSSEDASEVASPPPITPKHKSHWMPTTTEKTRKGGSFSLDRDLKATPQNPIPYGVVGNDLARTSARPPRLLSLGTESTTTEQEKPQNVDEAVAEAKKTLSLIRQKEQAARPLRIVRQDPQHAPDEALKKRFQQLVDEELKIRRLNARDWLRVATWWLLKVRMAFVFLKDVLILSNPAGAIQHATRKARFVEHSC